MRKRKESYEKRLSNLTGLIISFIVLFLLSNLINHLSEKQDKDCVEWDLHCYNIPFIDDHQCMFTNTVQGVNPYKITLSERTSTSVKNRFKVISKHGSISCSKKKTHCEKFPDDEENCVCEEYDKKCDTEFDYMINLTCKGDMPNIISCGRYMSFYKECKRNSCLKAREKIKELLEQK